MRASRGAPFLVSAMSLLISASCGTSKSGLAQSGVCEPRCSACSGENLWGAVAYSPSTNACGFSYAWDEQTDAESAARDDCGQKDCILVSPIGNHGFTNGCTALATETPFRVGGAYATASRLSIDTAQKDAVSTCQEK